MSDTFSEKPDKSLREILSSNDHPIIKLYPLNFLIKIISILPIIGLAVLLRAKNVDSAENVASLLGTPFSLLGTAAMTSCFGSYFTGQRPSPLRSYWTVLRRLPTLLLTTFMMLVLVVCGMALTSLFTLSIFALFFTVPRIMFVNLVCVLERKSVIDSFSRSYKLSADRFWALVVIAIASGLIQNYLAEYVSTLIAPGDTLGQGISRLMFISLMDPILDGHLVIQYFKARCSEDDAYGVTELRVELMRATHAAPPAEGIDL